jgi:hypothetical protein
VSQLAQLSIPFGLRSYQEEVWLGYGSSPA